jgi:hypothetical protein
VIGCPQQVTSDTEEVLGDSVHRQKQLRLSRGLEPPHSMLPLAGRLAGDFRPIVRVSVSVMDHRRHDARGSVSGSLLRPIVREEELCIQLSLGGFLDK